MFWKKEVPQAEFNFEAMHPVSIERRDKLTIITAKDKAASKEEFEVEVTCSISVHNYLVSRFRQACMINQPVGNISFADHLRKGLHHE